VSVTPHIPPLWTTLLPGTGGAVGGALEDFQVDEVPAYLPSGAGEHWYVRIRKRGTTTRDAVLALARAAGVPERDIGYAGMKDKHGVTSQWLSLPGNGRAPETWNLPPEVELVESARHGNKLRTGHLRGNRFRIGLAGTVPGAADHARAIFALLAERGHANYFGTQRFGREGRNLPDALGWLSGEQRLPRSRERFLSKLYSSVVQAEVFNRYATKRLELGAERLLAGEVVRLAGAGASFVVTDAAEEQPRLDARDVCLTGPMPGPKMRAAAAAALELEAGVLGELGLTDPALKELGRHAPGTRRDLLVPLEDARVVEEGDRLVLEFGLPAGSYATGVVRELTRGAVAAYDGHHDA
jgi:tRNA pseudouridine13 synthase